MTQPGIYRSKLSFEQGFTRIPNQWLRDSRAGFRAKGLLAYLLSHEVGYTITLGQIERETGDGRHAIRTAVDELVAVGYLTVERTHNERGWNAGLAWYLSEPSPESEIPTLENPTLENQTAIEEKVFKKKTDLERVTTRATRIPANFEVTEQMRAWAAENHPDVDLAKATLNFIDYWETKPKNNTKLDWVRTWQVWIRNTKPESTLPKQRKTKIEQQREAKARFLAKFGDSQNEPRAIS